MAAAIAGCLGYMSYGEKACRKLAEHSNQYKDWLYHDEVYESFVRIFTKARKFCKPEFKEFLNETLAKLAAQHEKGAHDHQATLNAARAKEGKPLVAPPP